MDYTLDDLAADTPDYSLPGGGYLKDGDTIVDPQGRNVRIQGVNAYETQKFLKSKTSGSQLGADTQAKIVHDLITQGGFNQYKVSKKKDLYGRYIGTMVNDKGEDLGTHLLSAGLASPMEADENQLRSASVGRLERALRASKHEESPEDILREALVGERNAQGIMAKQYTRTAKGYGSTLDEAGHSDYFAGPSYVNPDEDRQGNALSNLKTGLSSGIKNTKQGVWDAMDLVGTATGSEYLHNLGKSKGDALATDMANLPNLKGGDAINERGEWNLRSISDVGNYLVGQAATSSPQMALSLMATFAAPATFGLSLAIPAAIYSGNTWRGQDEDKKSAGWALTSGITQSAIETLGVTGVFSSIFERKAQAEILAQLMKKGMTKEAAESAMVSTIKESIKQVADAKKLVEGNFLQKAGKGFGKGILNEAPEEALQEYTQYLGETSGDFSPDTPEGMIKLQNRIANAAIGGAALGGTLGAGMSVARSSTQKPPAPGSTDSEYRSKMLDQFGEVPEAAEVVSDIHTAVESSGELETLEGLSTEYRSATKLMGVGGKVKNWWNSHGGLKGLYGSFANDIMGEHNYSSVSMATLGSLLGANRSINGGSIDEQRSDVTNQLSSSFGSPDAMRKAFKGMSVDEVSSLLRSKDVYKGLELLFRNKERSKDFTIDNVAAKFDMSKYFTGAAAEHTVAIIEYAKKLDTFINTYNSKTNSKIGLQEVLGNKSLDKMKVAKNTAQFRTLLENKLGLTKEQSTEIMSRILNNDSVGDINDSMDELLNFDSSFNKMKGNVEMSLNDPSVSAAFSEFMENSLANNIQSLSNKGGAQFVNMSFIGVDGTKLASLLQAAVKEGVISKGEASRKASELKDWLDMRTGKYHEIKSPFLNFALQTVNFLSTISSLPLAAISSTVEFSQIYRNLNTTQSLKATMALLKGFGGEISHVYKKAMGKPDTSEYREKMYAAGFIHEGNMGRRADIISGYYQKWTEGFFKMTGLTSITNVTRYAKLSIGADAINSWVKQVQANPESQGGKDAYSHLMRIGIDVDRLVNLTEDNPGNQQWVFDELTKGSHNFVNEAVVHPSKLNRPKFYSDPYLQLFTQFQGYVSTFTAQILPRLLQDLRKTGSADQVNSAATIAMMFALSYFALYMKDLIKYGESPPEWLKDEQRFQRYIGQVGLLGTGQRVVDTFFPMIDDKTKRSVLGEAAHAVAEQAPALAFIGKIDDALSAKDGSQIKKTARLLPFFGTSPSFATYLQSELGGKN